MNAVLTCMVSDAISSGGQAQKTAKTISRELGYHGGVGFTDIQRCLEAALSLIGLEKGDRVALSPLSPFWYHGVLKSFGAVPAYWDIDPETCLPVWEKGLDEKIQAVLCHHHLGIPSSTEFWHERSIPVIEDVTEAVGSIFRDEKKESRGKYGFWIWEKRPILLPAAGGCLWPGRRRIRGRSKNILKG